jgi:hypothetical protein
MASVFEFAREFKVMEDAEDGLDDLHEFWRPVAEFSKSRSGAGCGVLGRVFLRDVDQRLKFLSSSSGTLSVSLPPDFREADF